MQCREAFLAYRETGRAGSEATVNGFVELHRRVAAASGSVPANGYAYSSPAAADLPRPSPRARHSDFAFASHGP